MLSEETKSENTTLEGSAFARVLGRLMEARGIPADQEHALELAEKSGLGREVFRARLAGEDADPGDLTRFAEELALSAEEMRALAYAYTYEREREEKSMNDPREGWTQEERDLYDAKAEEEAWSHAIELLEPMHEIARLSASRELERLLKEAQDTASEELNKALDAQEAILGKGAV